MDSPKAKFSTMRGISGKVDSGSASGDKQIPPGIGGGGAGSAKKGVEASTQTGSKQQIPPMHASPKSTPSLKEGTLD